MIIGTAWYGFRRFSVENYMAAAGALSLRHIEVPLYGHIIHDYLFNLRDTAALRRLADEAGVEMHAGVAALDLAQPFDIRGLPIGVEAVEFNVALGRRIIDVGAELGLQVIRLTEPNIGEVHLHLADQYMEDYGHALRGLGNYAADRGIKVVAENYGLTSIQMKTLLDAADHPNVGTLFDPCNYLRIGEDPTKALSLLGHKVFYCHVKDTSIDDKRTAEQLFPGSRWKPSVAVGAGDIDWSTVLATLSLTYSGVLAIECEMPDDVVLATMQSRNYLRDRLAALEGSL